MAVSTIAQTPGSVKQEISEGSVKSFMSRFDFDPDDHRISGPARKFMIEQIMSGSNDEAFAILCSVGTVGFVPEIGYNSIPLNEFADFYGVSEKYLKSALQRNGFTRKSYPDDISMTSLWGILLEKPPLEPCLIEQQKRPWDLNTYRIKGEYDMKVSLPNHHSFSMYSPRVVLAAALVMSEFTSSITRVLLALKHNLYRFIDRFIKRTEDEPVKDENQNKPVDGIPVTGDGKLILSAELFTAMIKTAVKEAVSEVMTEFREVSTVQQVRIPAAEPPRDKDCHAKLKRPDNWDTVVCRWRHGSMKAEEAAKMTGMSISSFRNYANGRRTFD